MATNEYIIAVRRDRRDDVPVDWLEVLTGIDGVSVLGSTPMRAQIVADEPGIERARASLGSYLRIEPAILHHVQ